MNAEAGDLAYRALVYKNSRLGAQNNDRNPLLAAVLPPLIPLVQPLARSPAQLSKNGGSRHKHVMIERGVLMHFCGGRSLRRRLQT